MAKKEKPRRVAIHLNGVDKTLEIKKVAHLHLESGYECIMLEKIKGSEDWRLTYTAKTIPDIKKLQSLDFVREEL